MSKNNKPETPEDYLKKIQSQTSEQKRQEAMKILNRGNTAQQRPSLFGSWLKIFQQRFMTSFEDRKKQFIKQSKISENRHILIITCFFVGVVYISWKIEDKYDKMRNRARNTKSMKTRQVEAQNQYIQRMLAKNPFEPVPIEEEEKQEREYIFQKSDVEFDTKADLMEIMEQERGNLVDDDLENM